MNRQSASSSGFTCSGRCGISPISLTTLRSCSRHEGSATEVCEMLDAGTADIGIVYEQFIDKKIPLTIRLYNDRLCAVVARTTRGGP